MTRRALHSVAALSLLLSGCATIQVRPEPGVAGGQIWTKPGRAGVVVAAPHGTSDPYTGEIAAELARRTGFGLVVAGGFGLEAEGSGRPARRALHIEIPRAARVDWRPLYTASLADFLGQAAALLSPPPAAAIPARDKP